MTLAGKAPQTILRLQLSASLAAIEIEARWEAFDVLSRRGPGHKDVMLAHVSPEDGLRARKINSAPQSSTRLRNLTSASA